MKTSLTGFAASCTVNKAVWRTAPFDLTRFARQVPRLSTVCPSTSDVSVEGSVYRYSVWGSEDATSDCLTWPVGSTHSTCHGNKVTGTPVALAHTTSPRKKSVLGVVQSSAKVLMDSDEDWGTSRSGSNNDEREAKP